MFTKVWQDFEKGNFAPVYLLVGEESYFVDETIKRIKDALGKEEETEVMTFDLNEQPVDFVIDEADTIPFFTERKLIIAKNASFLKAAEKGKEKIEHDIKRLENWLANPTDTAVTIFIAPYEKLDERKKIAKLMKEKSVVLLAQTPQNNDLNAWIRSEATKNGKAITETAIQKLIEMVGPNMLQHQMEIEKIALYLGEENEISAELVEDLVAKTLEQDAFKMLNAYLNNKQEEALLIYHDLLRQKEEPIKLVGLLANNIRTMIHVYYLQKKGYHQNQIAKHLKVHPYRVQMVANQKNRASDQRLLQALYTLANVDLQLKTTGGNRERHLELFLMQQL